VNQLDSKYFNLKHYGFEYGKNVFFIANEEEIINHNIGNKLLTRRMVFSLEIIKVLTKLKVALDTESHLKYTNTISILQIASEDVIIYAERKE